MYLNLGQAKFKKEETFLPKLIEHKIYQNASRMQEANPNIYMEIQRTQIRQTNLKRRIKLKDFHFQISKITIKLQ